MFHDPSMKSIAKKWPTCNSAASYFISSFEDECCKVLKLLRFSVGLFFVWFFSSFLFFFHPVFVCFYYFHFCIFISQMTLVPRRPFNNPKIKQVLFFWYGSDCMMYLTCHPNYCLNQQSQENGHRYLRSCLPFVTLLSSSSEHSPSS